jgi:hypothetical protein
VPDAQQPLAVAHPSNSVTTHVLTRCRNAKHTKLSCHWQLRPAVDAHVKLGQQFTVHLMMQPGCTLASNNKAAAAQSMTPRSVHTQGCCVLNPQVLAVAPSTPTSMLASSPHGVLQAGWCGIPAYPRRSALQTILKQQQGNMPFSRNGSHITLLSAINSMSDTMLASYFLLGCLAACCRQPGEAIPCAPEV